MISGHTFEGLTFREWGTKAFDASLLRNVPADQLTEFKSRIRHLTDGLVDKICERLFRGIRRPFHFSLTSGWMRNALQLDREKARCVTTERLGEELGWRAELVVFLVYHTASLDVLAGQWSLVWDCLRSGWVNTWDNPVLCSNESKWAAVFWEGGMPRCVSRGDRRLLSSSN
jgi:hypothetical protein